MSCCTQNAAELLRINSNMISQPFLEVAAVTVTSLFFIQYFILFILGYLTFSILEMYISVVIYFFSVILYLIS